MNAIKEGENGNKGNFDIAKNTSFNGYWVRLPNLVDWDKRIGPTVWDMDNDL